MPIPVLLNGVAHLLLGQSQLSEQAMRALELKGDLPQLLDPRYQLGINVEDFTAFPYDYLRRRIGYQASVTPGAVAAQRPQWSFNLPNVSGRPQSTLAHVTELVFHNPTAAAVEFAWGLSSNLIPGLGGLIQGRPRDCRAFGASTGNLSVARLNFGSAAATILTNVIAQFQLVPATSTVRVRVDFVVTGQEFNLGTLSPVSLLVEAGTVNIAVNTAVIWSEREMVTSEVT